MSGFARLCVVLLVCWWIVCAVMGLAAYQKSITGLVVPFVFTLAVLAPLLVLTFWCALVWVVRGFPGPLGAGCPMPVIR